MQTQIVKMINEFEHGRLQPAATDRIAIHVVRPALQLPTAALI
jgi:hypothetical protein